MIFSIQKILLSPYYFEKMETEKDTSIAYLESLLGDNLPETLTGLSEDTLGEIRKLVDQIIYLQTAGVDKAFEMTGVTIKFIPGFLLYSLIKSYIEPSVAARITRVLEIKEVLRIASGLSLDYLGETLIYMQDELAAKTLLAMEDRKAADILYYVFEKKPLKILDICVFLPDNKLSRLLGKINLNIYNALSIHSSSREHSLKRLLNIL